MQFAETVRYLLGLGHETLAIKLGLRNISLLLEKLGNPQDSFASVQIAGTNGKGSTAVMLASITTAAGHKTGLFTSPHLVAMTERISINQQTISQELFSDCVTRVRAAAEELLNASEIQALPSFFEHVTAAALLAFAEQEVELAILETGMGGRLDATTAAGAKVVGITQIAMDHEEYLGDSLAKIAAEKAAIIRPGKIAFAAPQLPEAETVIRARAEECGVALQTVGETRIIDISDDGRAVIQLKTSRCSYQNLQIGLRGRHQAVNAAVAVGLAEALTEVGLKVDGDAIAKGLATARNPGRLELLPTRPPVMLDGAHNPAGTRALRAYLDEFVAAPITLVFGAMKEKRLAEMAEILFPAAAQIILTEADSPRSADANQLATLARKFISPEKVSVAAQAGDAIEQAFAVAGPAGYICVAGSLYLVGEIRNELIHETKNE